MISLKSMIKALTESRRMSNDRLSSLLESKDVIINLSTAEKSSNTKLQSQGNRNRMQIWHSEFRAEETSYLQHPDPTKILLKSALTCSKK